VMLTADLFCGALQRVRGHGHQKWLGRKQCIRKWNVIYR